MYVCINLKAVCLLCYSSAYRSLLYLILIVLLIEVCSILYCSINSCLSTHFVCLFVCSQKDVLSKTQEKAATSLTEVTWLDQRVPVKNEKLRVALIKLQQLEGELGRTASSDEKMEMYERLLMECQDSMQILREDLASETVL